MVRTTLLLVSIMFLGLGVFACGGDAVDSGGDGAAEEAQASVRIDVPDGWVSAAEGNRQVAAGIESDLEAYQPDGPRFSASGPSADGQVGDDVYDVVAASAASVADWETLGEPDEVQVAGVDGVAITMRSGTGDAAVTQRQIIVNRDGAAYTFMLEAPTTMWGEAEPDLEAILATVRFVDP